MECNPIQQRAEELELKYLELKDTHPYTFLVLRTPSDDCEMIDAFYDYMVAVDNEIDDVVVVFKSGLQQVNLYSKALVEELFMSTFLWNYTDKPPGIESNYIQWKMDVTTSDTHNVAALFVSNINAFCASVEFEEDSYLVCVLDDPNKRVKAMLRWLKDLAVLELHPKVRLVLSDTFEQPIFDELQHFAPKSTHILPHFFGLAQAIKEVAAMGDPDAPDTKYRYHLVQLYDAIAKRQKNAIDQHANSCLAIADRFKETEVHWYIQKTMVYCALATSAYSEQQVNKAISYMDEGISILQEIEGQLSEDLVGQMAAQSHLFRGSLFMMLNKSDKAIEDFKSGVTHCENRQDYLMQIEAYRLLAQAADKGADKQLRYDALNKGLRLGQHLSAPIIQASTYALLVKEVLDSRYTAYISDSELDSLLQPLLGEKWRVNAKNVKSMMTNKTEK